MTILTTSALEQTSEGRVCLHSIAQHAYVHVAAFHRMGIASSPSRAMPTPAPRNDARRAGGTWRPPQADDVIASHGLAMRDCAKQSPCDSVRAMRRTGRSDVNGESGWSVDAGGFLNQELGQRRLVIDGFGEWSVVSFCNYCLCVLTVRINAFCDACCS